MRAEPPADLPEDAAQVWREIVEVLPADWFGRENYDVLAGMCLLVIRRKGVTARLEELRGVSVREMMARENHDLRTEERELVKGIAALATKLRLIQQSRMSKGRSTVRSHHRAATERAWD